MGSMAEKNITKDNAEELGRRGGEASAKSRTTKPTLADLKELGPSVLKELLDAGMGKGKKWSNLEPKERLSALKAVTPYLLGRPLPMQPDEEKPIEGAAKHFDVGVKPTDQQVG